MTLGYLLDTNHVSRAVTPTTSIRKRVMDLRARGVKIGTCVPVLCEIEAGIQQVKEPVVYRANLDRLLRDVRLWPIDGTTAQRYGELHRELKKRGRVLSQVDIMLAALARQMQLILVTTDQDFVGIPKVRIENWYSSDLGSS